MPPSFRGVEDETKVGVILVCVGIILASLVYAKDNGGFRHPGEIFLVERFLPFPRLRLGHKLPEIPVFLASLAKAEIMLPADGNDPGIAPGVDIHAFHLVPGVALRREFIKIPVFILVVLSRADINLPLRCESHCSGSPAPREGCRDGILSLPLGIKYPEVVQLFRCMRKPAVLSQPEIELVAGSEKHRPVPCPARERGGFFYGWRARKAIKCVVGCILGAVVLEIISVDIVSVVAWRAVVGVSRKINGDGTRHLFPCPLCQGMLQRVGGFVLVASPEEEAANERYVQYSFHDKWSCHIQMLSR